jgi:hypothetical protein
VSHNLIDLVADLELDTLQDQLAVADAELAARKADLTIDENAEQEAKQRQQPILMEIVSNCSKELVDAETAYFPEGITLLDHCDFEGLGGSIAKKRNKLSFANGCLTHLVENIFPDLRIKTMTARIATVASEARMVEAETLVAAKKIGLALGPALQETGELDIVSERLETLLRHAALLWEKHASLTAELTAEGARQEKARAARASAGGFITSTNFIQ